MRPQVMLLTEQPVGLGPYLPPVFKALLLFPPQMTISLPVQTAVCKYRALGASLALVAVQLSVLGLYLPPVFKSVSPDPPHTIISLPHHTAA
jgi:hypothetical protein